MPRTFTGAFVHKSLDYAGLDRSQDRFRYDTMYYKSDPTSGPYITMQGGKKFRRATNYSVAKYWFEPMSAQTTKAYAYWSGNWSLTDPPGGFVTDALFDGNWVHDILQPYSSDARAGPTAIQSQINEAGTKARLDIADQKAGIGEDLATFRQTLQLIKNPLGTLVKELDYVGRKKSLWPYLYRFARSFTKGELLDAAAAEYLKFVYGWKPLMQDIHGILELAKDSSGRPLLLRGRGSSKIQEQLGPLVVNDISGYTLNKMPFRDVKSRVTCTVWAQVDPDQAGLRTLNQLGLLNPASLAWELVPWSFVVDWVLPIGSVLSALSAPAGLRFVDGSVGNRLSMSAPLDTHDYRLEGDSAVVLTENSSSSSMVKYDGYTRTTLSNWPEVGLWVDRDPFKMDRSFKALALAILALPKLRR